jgi:hypothetical protein
MKPIELTSRKRLLNLQKRFTLRGLLLTALVLVITAGIYRPGLVAAGTPTVYAALPIFQDELQLQLGTNGFTPANVQRAAGTFAIAVENSAIEGEYTLQLKAHDGTVMKEVQVQKGSAAWTVTLAAGEYTLAEASHPQWLCRITVQ